MPKIYTKWQEAAGVRFINPYNFVRLNTTVDRKAQEKGELTGVIHCRLQTKTPLAIPDEERKTMEMTNDTRTPSKKHKKYPFFRVGNTAIIPGSEIRGVIRSAYEAVTNSCMSVINTNILTARHPTPRIPGCILYNKKTGKWALFNASVEKSKRPGSIPHPWKDIKGNNRTRYFVVGSTVIVGISDNAVKDYLEVLAMYRSEKNYKLNSADYTGCGVTPEKDGGIYPVFYEQIGSGEVYFSPAQVSRSVFHNRLSDLIGELKPCGNKDLLNKELCPACRLFGKLEGGAASGSVRFGDAEMIPRGQDFISDQTLKELSSPKPSAVEMYTHRPDGALFWNYDYKITAYKRGGKGEPAIPTRSPCPVKINGRKFYLHHKPDTLDYLTVRTRGQLEKTERNSTMELVKSGREFRFDIWFEQISEEQLNALLWILTFGSADNDINDGKLWHKIGHGKPLGLGSVKIVADSVETRKTYCKEGRISRGKLTKYPVPSVNPFSGNNSYGDLSHIAEARFDKVSYPLADDGTDSKNSKAIHQWFTANRQVDGGINIGGQRYYGKGVEPVIGKTLPLVQDIKSRSMENLFLPKYEKR